MTKNRDLKPRGHARIRHFEASPAEPPQTVYLGAGRSVWARRLHRAPSGRRAASKSVHALAENHVSEDLPHVSWQLVVEEPSAAGGLATQRIALRTNLLELDYFAGSRWTEGAPRLVQTLLVESFENTGRIVAVGRQSIGLRSDFNLKSELREFQAEYLDRKSVV